MRIAVSGSAGTGKTTLARALGARLGLPVIGEGMREFLERTGIDLHTLSHGAFKDLVRGLWEERRATEEAAWARSGGFVADRAGVDFAAFWMFYRFAREEPETEALMREALDPARYDRIFLLPGGAIPLVADGVRTPDRYVQSHIELLIRGLLAGHCGLGGQGAARRARWIEVRAISLEAREAEILAATQHTPAG